MRIFVTVGNAPARFDRLLQLVDGVLSGQRFAEATGTCQHGTSGTRPARLRNVEVLSRAEFDDELRSADAVITHAGVGSLSSAIRAGHRPIVVPRRFNRREHVNDHQLEIARELERRGLIVVAEDEASIARALTEARRSRVPQAGDVDLGELLAAFLAPDRRPVPGSRLLLRTLALAAPSIERMRLR